MKRDLGLFLLPAAALLFAIAFACGADNVDAPRADPVFLPDGGTPVMCKSFDDLMPGFVNAIHQGRTENLRKVIKDHLLVPDRPEDPPVYRRGIPR